jgi:hypothetical protein
MKNTFENKNIDYRQTENVENINKKYEKHLENGFRPIMACVGTPDQFKVSTPKEEFFDEGEKDYEIDYYKDHEKLVFDDFKNPETFSYVISPVDQYNKYSNQFANCTGVIGIGYNKNLGKNISFMSHEDPDYFLEKRKNINFFLKDFNESLSELKNRSENGSIDAVIFGGNFFYKSHVIKNYKEYQRHYIDSIKLLADEIKNELGFEPIVIIGPKTTYGLDNVYFDNKNRRLYISRSEVGNATTESFLPTELEEYLKKI